MKNTTPKAENLYEVSWEVCNKVGGIYSVLTTKAQYLQEKYDTYITIGPYIEEKAKKEFKEQTPPGSIQDAFDQLSKEGIKARYGEWLIPGQPKTILLEWDGLRNEVDRYKEELWETYEIDSLRSGSDFDNPLLFSKAASKLLQLLEEDKTILHAHEWMTGFTILDLDLHDSDINTVFTTHATMLGRTMAGNGYALYEDLESFNSDEEAKNLGVEDKHTTEKATAHTTDIFTTVSEITQKEAKHIHGREPEILTMNGLNMKDFPSIEKSSIKHVQNRDLIREFLSYTFFPYYRFNVENNLTFMYAGRYEYENKGLDILIESLARLNERMKERDDDRTISAFFFVAMPNQGVKKELFENKNTYRHMKHYVDRNREDIQKSIVDAVIDEKEIEEDIFDTTFLKSMRRDIYNFKKEGKPPMTSHELYGDEDDNEIIQLLKEKGLTNEEEDKVKVMLYPAYLDGNDGLLNLDYHDTLSGSHLGIFPSYYEPWGYTPLESAALGVPNVTTDLAGFGRFMMKKEEYTGRGIYILNREQEEKEDIIENLTDILTDFSNTNHSERVSEKIMAKQLSKLADWKNFVNNYIEAHNEALQ
mgnify:CR=1 FL=1